MHNRDDFPEIGAVFWPVGKGDSTTLLLGENVDGTNIVVQVDLHHTTTSEDVEGNGLIEKLVAILPVVDDQPYLAAFVLSHPDQDHCRGFEDLLASVTIGDLWLTPRVFDEYDKDLSDDATAFKVEAERRLALALDGSVESGDRVRVVGRPGLFDQAPYDALDEGARGEVGTVVDSFDGHDMSTVASAFLHGPVILEDEAFDRNDTSLSMRVVLRSEGCEQRLLLLGDLARERIAQVLDESEDEDLEWDVLLAPHHCSKRALFDDDNNVDGWVVDGLTRTAGDGAWVVSSSPPIPGSDKPGDDPPHKIAWEKYGDVAGASDRVVCTSEHGDPEDPDPVVFDVSGECGYAKPAASEKARAAIVAAVTLARQNPLPRDPTGYGEA